LTHSRATRLALSANVLLLVIFFVIKHRVVLSFTLYFCRSQARGSAALC